MLYNLSKRCCISLYGDIPSTLQIIIDGCSSIPLLTVIMCIFCFFDIPPCYAQSAGSGFTLATINTSGEGTVGGLSNILAIYAGTDMDNDGKGEIITVDGPTTGNSEMLILEATGTDNTYTVVWRTDLTGRMSKRCGLAVGDTDGDGNSEIIVGVSSTVDSIYIFEVDKSLDISDNSNPFFERYVK